MTDVFYKMLKAEAKNPILFEDVHRIFLSSSPGARSSNDNGISSLLLALEAMKEQGAVRYSSAVSGTIPLGRHNVPAEIRITKDKKPKVEIPARQWDSRILSEALNARGERLNFLTKLDSFLKQMPKDLPIVPIKARSLQIFGDEKALSLRAATELRRTGNILEHLTPYDLRCYVPDEHYFVYSSFAGAASSILVVENSETYHLMKERNRSTDTYRAIVYGAGNAFSVKAPHIVSLAKSLGADTLFYFGDIDAPGFQIAHKASAAIESSGSSLALLPAVELYRECVEIGIPQPSGYGTRYDWENKRDCDTRMWVQTWLDRDVPLFNQIDKIVSTQKRLAQEWIGLSVS